MQSDGRKHAVKVVPKKAKFRKGTFGTFTSSTILSSCRYFGSTRRLTGPPSFLKRDLVGCNRVVGERLIPNSSQSPPKANSGIRPRVTAQKLYLAPWDGKASHWVQPIRLISCSGWGKLWFFLLGEAFFRELYSQIPRGTFAEPTECCCVAWKQKKKNMGNLSLESPSRRCRRQIPVTIGSMPHAIPKVA